jgi:hypothetical protein
MRVRVVGLFVLAGCWSGTDAAPAKTPYPDDAPPEKHEPFPLHSEWRGTYRCSQGLTNVFLKLDAQRDGSLQVIFEFGPTDDNPMIQSGAYELRGTIKESIQHTFDVAVQPFEWIQQPPGYTMTPFSAKSSRRWTRLVGSILHPNCGELDVRRSD